MANWTHSITSVARDSNNFNILVDITYTDDSVPPRTALEKNYKVGVFPLSVIDTLLPAIDEHARKRIKEMLEPGDLTLDTITAVLDKPRTIPADPTEDPKQAALTAADQAFGLALRNVAMAKQVEMLADPDLTQKYADLQAATIAVQK